MTEEITIGDARLGLPREETLASSSYANVLLRSWALSTNRPTST